MADKLAVLDASKIALAESMKKVSEIKKKQWDVSVYTTIILGFLYSNNFEHPDKIKGVLFGFAIGVFVYYGFIFYQTFGDRNRFIKIYKNVFHATFPTSVSDMYKVAGEDSPFEDEGRFQLALPLVVLAAFALLLTKIFRVE